MNFFNNYINNNNEDGGTRKNILTAYTILLAHIFLLFCIALAILFFKGFYIYIGWILAGIGIAAIVICFLVYKRLTRSSTDIRNIISMPEFENRSLEIKLIGGLASFKIRPEHNPPPNVIDPNLSVNHNMNNGISAAPKYFLTATQSDNKSDTVEQKIMKLISLFEKNLITEDEFKKAKERILEENI
jgi:hypothetical protein